MYKYLTKMLTNNHTEVPLIMVSLDYEKYTNNGAAGSCEIKVHPLINTDKHVKEQLNNLIDYIRDNYKMEDII